MGVCGDLATIRVSAAEYFAHRVRLGTPGVAGILRIHSTAITRVMKRFSVDDGRLCRNHVGVPTSTVGGSLAVFIESATKANGSMPGDEIMHAAKIMDSPIAFL